MALIAAGVVLIAGVAAVIWPRPFGDDDGVDAVLDEPGAYAAPGDATNPPLTIERLPVTTLVDATGTEIGFAPDGDRPMVVNLWYTTCPPCSRELGAFALVDDELGDQVRFVGVDPYDGDTAEAMVAFAAARGVTYELLRDPGAVLTDQLAVAAFPTTVFVDADGRIRGRSGALDAAALRAKLRELWGIG